MLYIRFELNQQENKALAGFTLIETLIVIAIVILLTGVGVPSFKHLIASNRLQEVSWQMVQDLRTVKEDAILYQQDLNVYFDFNNSPVEPTDASNKNNRRYLFETFQSDLLSDPPLHYIPTDSPTKHFLEKILKYNFVIDNIASDISLTIVFDSKKYFVLTFRSGAGSTFRGETDVTTSMTGTSNRQNNSSVIINEKRVVIKIKDPNSDLAFYVIVDGVGNISMYGSPPS